MESVVIISGHEPAPSEMLENISDLKEIIAGHLFLLRNLQLDSTHGTWGSRPGHPGSRPEATALASRSFPRPEPQGPAQNVIRHVQEYMFWRVL